MILSDENDSRHSVIRARSGCEIAIDPNANSVTAQADSVIGVHARPGGVWSTRPPALPSTMNRKLLTTVLEAQ